MVIIHTLSPFVVGDTANGAGRAVIDHQCLPTPQRKEHYLMESLSQMWDKDANKSLQLRFI